MKSLELKIPPPAIALFVALAMWGLALATPSPHMLTVIRVSAALAIALAGVAFALAGVAACRRAKTTVNPTKPQTTSALIGSGIYAVTRNPMYLGLLLVLIALAVFLSSLWALLGPVAFFLYIGRFQIAPEERALAVLFGAQYDAYLCRVRRWL
jgi:protein-S-isoprenylcysteine O-methyltransferase Ste14